MKNILYVMLLFLPLSLLAQEHKKEGHEKLTPEQKATLHSKKLRLHLELNANQEEKVKATLAKHFEAMQKQLKAKEEQERSAYEQQLQHLDVQLQLQEKMKSILEPEQYKAWKKIHAMRGQMASHEKRKMKKGALHPDRPMLHKKGDHAVRPERPNRPRKRQQN